jgi:hypothetical protein
MNVYANVFRILKIKATFLIRLIFENLAPALNMNEK